MRLAQRTVVRTLATVAAALLPSAAAAEPSWLAAEDPNDPWALPDAPAPPTLPDLTHRALAASLETTFTRMQVRPAGTDAVPTSETGLVERLELEQSLSIRRWYLGISEDLAASTAPSGNGFLWVGGQPEIWGRAVWASAAGLAYGGGLGLVAPLFSHAAGGTQAAESVRVVRPWDQAQFLNAWTLRPFIDVRQVDGPIILQLRQGLDWSIATGDSSGTSNPISAAIAGATQISTRTTFFIGYRPHALVGLGLELWEVYVIKPAELRRATYAISPSVRLMTPLLQPALSFLAPIDRPLVGSVESYWAVRLGFSVILDNLFGHPL